MHRLSLSIQAFLFFWSPVATKAPRISHNQNKRIKLSECIEAELSVLLEGAREKRLEYIVGKRREITSLADAAACGLQRDENDHTWHG